MNASIIKRAREKKLIAVAVHNLRDYTEDKHKKVDGKPYGGGPGMVMKAEPIVRAVRAITKKSIRPAKRVSKSVVIIVTPGGAQFTNTRAAQYAKKYNHITLIAGRYEGIDARVKQILRASGHAIHEVSIGPYVLTGGEVPAMAIVDAITRQIPGVLGKEESLEEKRLGVGIPVYTRPEIIKQKGKTYKIPKVLRSGNHKKVEEWRRKHIV